MGNALFLAYILATIERLGQEYQVNPAIIAAIVEVESGFNPLAVGDARSSFGLMQLHIGGAGGGHPPSQLLEIEYNLRIGIEYVKRCLEATSYSLPDALSAYNQGIQGWKDRGQGFNQLYVDLALGVLDKYEQTGLPKLVLTYLSQIDLFY